MTAKELKLLTTKVQNMSIVIDKLEKAFLDVEKSVEKRLIKQIQSPQQQTAWRSIFKAPPSNYKILKKRLAGMADSLKLITKSVK
jgi:hypothetical protein